MEENKDLKQEEKSHSSFLIYEYFEEQLFNELEKINIETSMGIMSPDDEESQFNVTVDWPYEQGNDEEDTYWGTLAYDYMKENNTSKCIDIKLDLVVEQVTDIEENNQP